MRSHAPEQVCMLLLLLLVVTSQVQGKSEEKKTK